MGILVRYLEPATVIVLILIFYLGFHLGYILFSTWYTSELPFIEFLRQDCGNGSKPELIQQIRIKSDAKSAGLDSWVKIV